VSAERLPCFKAYDVRGRIPDQLNVDLARKIGHAYAAIIGPKHVVIGKDIRESSDALVDALIEGLTDCGVDISHIGLCGTEMVYFATTHLKADGGIMVTASHNPRDYNGLKMVREGSRPISGDSGLMDIEAATRAGRSRPSDKKGEVRSVDVTDAYVDHLLSYVDVAALKPFRIVTNPGNGCAGPFVDALEKHLPFEFHKLCHEPDGSFPNGIPNPMIEENRPVTSNAVKEKQAAVGIAWDGDFDRCFFFDENGEFVEGYYIVALLARQILAKNPGAKVIHDPRLTWNTVKTVEESGGQAVLCKSGHAFIKEKMRAVDAIYAGEMSAHHYFREFSYSDSGMIPWLLVLQAMSKLGKSLAELVNEGVTSFPASGEINRTIPDPDRALEIAKEKYAPQALSVDEVDGISIEFADWRFNLRKSNTEPLVRLNVESRGDRELMKEKTAELLGILDGLQG
jgi:phosphomannomutase